MNLKDILSISGQSGLFKFVSKSRNGIIVESLETHNRVIAHATTKVSALEDIAIYTETKEVPLVEVFKLIHEREKGGETINPKSSDNELKKYFTEVLPTYDKEKVYVSDIKKVLAWYNALHKFKMLNFSDEPKKEEPDLAAGQQGGTEKKE